jgi:hypothetical protein
MEYNKAYHRQSGTQTTMPRISMVMQPKMTPPIAMAVQLKTMPCITMAWQTRMLGNAVAARQMTAPHIVVVAWWNMSWLLRCLTLPSCPLAVPPSRCTCWLLHGLRLKLPPPSNTTATGLYHPLQPLPPLPLPPGRHLYHCRHCRHHRHRCHCHYRGQTPVVYY